MKITKYSLEIFEPGGVDNVWVVFSSPTPFMTISVGDILNPGIWPGSQSPMKVLRVVGVEHIIHEIDGNAKHLIDVYTEEIEGTREARVSNVSAVSPHEAETKDGVAPMSAALDAVHNEAERLLRLDDLSDEVEQGLDRIVALARYKFPVTNEGNERPN